MRLAVIIATANPAWGFIVPVLGILAAIGLLVAVRILRRRPSAIQDDGAYANFIAVQATEAQIERLNRAIAEQRRRKRSTRALRIQRHEAEQRLAALTQS